MSEPHGRQFTLANLMALIAAVGLMMGLVLTFATEARVTSRRTWCINNQRQIGLGFQGYLYAHEALPNAVTWGERADAETSGSIIPAYERNDLDPAPGAVHPDHAVGPLRSWVIDVLPYVEQQKIYNDFDRTRPWDDPANSNRLISAIDIGILSCPKDDTLIEGRGNLSYVVNMGFNRWWYSDRGWDGAASPPRTGRRKAIDWGYRAAQKTGLMWPGTLEGTYPWDHRTTAAEIRDGLSTTVLLTENRYAGASDPRRNPYADGRLTGWACAHPNFVGFIASDDVCTGGKGGTCTTAGDLGVGPGRGFTLSTAPAGRGPAPRARPSGSTPAPPSASRAATHSRTRDMATSSSPRCATARPGS